MPAKGLNIAKKVAALERMTAKQLRERFAEVFGETLSKNKRCRRTCDGVRSP
jgi:hypothetical protein